LVVTVPVSTAVWGVLALYGARIFRLWPCCTLIQYVYYNAFVGGVEGASTNSSSLLGQFLCRGGAGSRGLICAPEYGADFEEHEFTVAVCGPPISAGYYSLRIFGSFAIAPVQIFLLPSRRITANDHCPAGRFIGSRGWVRSVSGAGSARSRRGATGREAGIGGAPFEADRWIAAVVEFAPVALIDLE